jgi:hypothetical protein
MSIRGVEHLYLFEEQRNIVIFMEIELRPRGEE